MLKISFKNVGQGDSIIIEWHDAINNLQKIGFIDCNKYQQQNPSLNYLIRSNYKEIEFVVLSHGHDDHCSGMLEFLNHCEKHKIRIKHFYHSLNQEHLGIYQRFHSMNEQKRLKSLLDKIISLHEDEVILPHAISPIYEDTREMTLTQSIKLWFLSPVHKNYTKLTTEYHRYINKETSSKPDMNGVSTIIKISTDNWYVLLTSDTTIDNLIKADKKLNDSECVLILCQAPHHGSIKNHLESFWKNRIKIAKCPVVFSVGDSPHKLPNVKVVNSFADNEYDIFSTNNVCGITEYLNLPTTNEANATLTVLDFVSTSLEDEQIEQQNIGKYQGDKVFELEDNQMIFKYNTPFSL
jgi:beta-lactamase superfamily II metal-dependent hydrolase